MFESRTIIKKHLKLRYNAAEAGTAEYFSSAAPTRHFVSVAVYYNLCSTRHSRITAKMSSQLGGKCVSFFCGHLPNYSLRVHGSYDNIIEKVITYLSLTFYPSRHAKPLFCLGHKKLYPRNITLCLTVKSLVLSALSRIYLYEIVDLKHMLSITY